MPNLIDIITRGFFTEEEVAELVRVVMDLEQVDHRLNEDQPPAHGEPVDLGESSDRPERWSLQVMEQVLDEIFGDPIEFFGEPEDNSPDYPRYDPKCGF